MDGCVRSRAHWNNTVNWRRTAAPFGSFLWSSSCFYLDISGIVTFTCWERAAFISQALITCYVSGVENTWWKVYSGIQPGRTRHQRLIKLRNWFVSFFSNLCVMYVEWRQRMDIIWEILIILQANFIVCISGELWASLVPFGAGASNNIHQWMIFNFFPYNSEGWALLCGRTASQEKRACSGCTVPGGVKATVCAPGVKYPRCFRVWLPIDLCVCESKQAPRSFQNWMRSLLTHAWHGWAWG